jgi:hypothetical protein
MEKIVARWTIGKTTPAGYECLGLSIASFTQLYDAKVVITHQGVGGAITAIADRFNASLHDQTKYLGSITPPMGVAWKLYPPRLFPDQREICIDNDIVFLDRIPEIETFLSSDCTLLLEGSSRNYGRFDRHVPPGYCINSGIYGMPVGFNFQKYINLYAGQAWEVNAFGEHAKSKTFDEQGLVAFALLNYGRFVIIPESTVTNCERHLLPGKGLHFVGLNRNQFHEPYRLFKSQIKRMYL